jgi:hypothetical protein
VTAQLEPMQVRVVEGLPDAQAVRGMVAAC